MLGTAASALPSAVAAPVEPWAAGPWPVLPYAAASVPAPPPVTTALPAAPVGLPAAPVGLPAVPVGLPPVPLAPEPDDLLACISALLLSGEAWADPAAAERRLLPGELIPEQAAPAAASAGRVSLGFRDGSTAQLDPASEQAAALEELALLLSLRD